MVKYWIDVEFINTIKEKGRALIPVELERETNNDPLTDGDKEYLEAVISATTDYCTSNPVIMQVDDISCSKKLIKVYASDKDGRPDLLDQFVVGG